VTCPIGRSGGNDEVSTPQLNNVVVINSTSRKFSNRLLVVIVYFLLDSLDAFGAILFSSF
jgi:hypothetical protein